MDLLVNGMAVTVLTSENVTGSRYHFDDVGHPTVTVGEGSEEVQALALFTFMHERAVKLARPEAVATVLFGFLKDNPHALSFILASQPPEHVLLPN